MRSELQTDDDPKCPGHSTGLHCACLDIHDACCDCTVHVGPDGDLCFETHAPMDCGVD